MYMVQYENRHQKRRFFRLFLYFCILQPAHRNLERIELLNWNWTNWIESNRIHISAGSFCSEVQPQICPLCTLSSNVPSPWLDDSMDYRESVFFFVRYTHCHRMTLVELFVFNIAPSPISSWHVSFISIKWRCIRKLVELAWYSQHM